MAKRAKREGWNFGVADDHVDIAAHQAIYEQESGDRQTFPGFDERLAKWAAENPRSDFGST